MAREGMDVDVVSSDATQMREIGQSGIPSIIGAVDSIVSDLHAQWHGPDSDAFVNEWHSTFKPNLTRIAGEVGAHGQLALTNVQEQQAASAAGTIG